MNWPPLLTWDVNKNKQWWYNNRLMAKRSYLALPKRDEIYIDPLLAPTHLLTPIYCCSLGKRTFITFWLCSYLANKWCVLNGVWSRPQSSPPEGYVLPWSLKIIHWSPQIPVRKLIGSLKVFFLCSQNPQNLFSFSPNPQKYIPILP